MYSNIFNVFSSLLVISTVDIYFQFAHCQSVPLVVEFWDAPEIYSSVVPNDIIIKDVPNNCTKALDLFTATVADLTRCSILNARPVRVCTNCINEINATEEAYRQLREEPSFCRKFYFESDQIGVINLVYNQGRDLWSKCFCKNCYDYLNETLEFFKVSKELDKCVSLFNKTSKGPNDTCNTCKEYFVKMTNIYKAFIERISDDASDRICMDIIDQMNITRNIWSSKNCLSFDSNIGYPNIVTAVLVGCIPVFFYMLSKSIAIIEDVKLVRPKRKSYASLQSESFQAE